MRITDIIKQKSDNEMYNIFINNEFAFSSSIEDILKHSIKLGREVDDEEVQHLREICEETKAYKYVLNLLKNRDYTEEQIKKKMIARGFSQSTIVKIINKLLEYNFINDFNYAQRYTNDCINFKKIGSNKIFYSLKSKGINQDILEKINFDDEKEYSNCYYLAQKKLHSMSQDTNGKRKIFRFLMTRGFDSQLIMRVLRDIDQEIEFNEEI
ncbi:hypothetical protein Q428_09205 [Fervidicella metallireducens AeB]|uniref:Regulatory protein RecX n=1 Tax=Fervidicella metallireducens AeB TaxID=1403537 RepID=A0A017RTW0_9CLOT|nr:RecX family transcriptional regulator [Fervidicella metallireducens]EYE88198.1 hypothetical protein Q428_09205 [Fervidicella metallireducens AeB]